MQSAGRVVRVTMEKFSLTSFSSLAPSWVRTGGAGRVMLSPFTVLLKPAVKWEKAGLWLRTGRPYR